ncbi:MAG: 2-C-methyl-D-erythritol 2,4-cyclodiphosphate synthase [Candidatus Hydrogenedentota bacterium]
MTKIRTGIGVDVHKFKKGKGIILGGVYIPYIKSLKGYSDADVLIHSIMDALLGAVSLQDIGFYFPCSEPEYKNISSLLLLKRVCSLIKKKRFRIININSMILAQEPKLSTYREAMIKNVEEISGKDTFSVQFSTTEHLGFIGRKEGILSITSVLVEKI